jgi:hypothetical protein
MATSTITAEVATVQFGNIEFEGLLRIPATGKPPEFFVAVPQISKLFQFDKNQASRYLKSLLGEDFQFDKVKTKLHPKAVNVIPLVCFERVMLELAFAGNKIAHEMTMACIGYTLEDRFRNAFDIEFTKEERNQWLLVRTQSKQLFRPLTDEIKVWMSDRTCTAPEFVYYAKSVDAVNVGTFGMSAKQIKEAEGLGKSDLTRDSFGAIALTYLNTIQDMVVKKLRKNHANYIDVKPWLVVEEVTQRFGDELPIDYKC